MSLLLSADFDGDGLSRDMLSADIPLRKDVVTPASHVVRQDLAAVTTRETLEVPVRTFSSDEMDQGSFGMRWHPVSGNWMEGVEVEFEPINRVLILSTNSSGGWSPSASGKKELPRIGDGKPHTAADFPLAHWKFDPQSGIPLKM